MKISWERITLNLKNTFRIAHGASDQRFNVLVHLGEGVGEAPAVPQYHECQDGIIAYLETVPELPDDLFDLEAILDRLPPGSRAGRAAIDVALHDAWGKKIGQPLYRLFGLNPEKILPTSFTIAMDKPELMAERARDLNYPIYKIKLGSDQDEQMIRAIRKATDATLRVDANAGWTREQALHLIPRLAEYNLELVEQPLAADDIEGLGWLKSRLNEQGFHLPIVADESAITSRDIARLAGKVDGVVVKLMKTEGLREGLRAIHTARALDMKVMISCMVETSAGVTAAAHLAPLCDYVDLDGPLLIKNDPFRGLQYQGANIRLSKNPGLGLTRI